MRSQTVPTHLTCNQNCTYCTARRATDDRAWIVGSAVRARIDAAIASGAEEIIISGGEPTMRNDLPALIEHAIGRGAKSVTLETNGTLIDGIRASALKKAGLSLARVNLSGFGDGLDAITRQPGGWTLAVNGLNALVSAEIPVEVSVAIVKSSLAMMTELPSRLAGMGVRALVARVPIESPDESEIVSYSDAAKAILALDIGARAVKIPLRIAHDSGPPPCLFPGPAASLFSLSPGAPALAGHAHVEACSQCQIRDRCSGFPKTQIARFGVPAMRPVTEDRFRRRLSVVGTVEDQIARELVRTNRRRGASTTQVLDERLIRINFQCNQACRFCFVPTYLPPASEQVVREAIISVGRDGARITLTGGEPTLNSNLIEYIRLAHANSKQPVGLQTNAVRMANPEFARAILAEGLDEVAVSLHGSNAAISDSITEAPGTFEKTIVGLDNVHAAGVPIDLTFVICQRNAEDLAATVRLVAARWPRAWMNIAFVAPSSDLVPRDADLVPRYSDVVPHLSLALREAKRLGVNVGGFESMCGIPLCLLPEDLVAYGQRTDETDGFENGSFIKTEACAKCSVESKCYGLRRGYFDMYGADELRPIAAATPSAPIQLGRRSAVA